MIQTAINLTEAITLTVQGIRQVAEKHKEVLEVARNIARSLAISKYEITSDDVRRECKLQPLHPNAWGAVFRDPAVKWTGKFSKSHIVSRHAGLQRIWRLRIG